MKITIALVASLLLALCVSSQLTTAVRGDSSTSVSALPTPTPVKEPTTTELEKKLKPIKDDGKPIKTIARIDCSKGGCPGGLTGTITLVDKLPPDIASFTCGEIEISLHKILPNKRIDGGVVAGAKAKGDIGTGKCQYEIKNLPANQPLEAGIGAEIAHDYPACAHEVALNVYSRNSDINPIPSGKKLTHDFKIALTCDNAPH
ncbi:MAG: hypothetical protein WBP93_23060 [Pyrinomonadaceae bacterium]